MSGSYGLTSEAQANVDDSGAFIAEDNVAAATALEDPRALLANHSRRTAEWAQARRLK